jgi:hypothetical protein
MPFPNVSNALNGWTRRVSARVVTKSIVDHRVVETVADATMDIVLQPMPAQEVNRKPEEQRSWKWWSLWVKAGQQELDIDDVVVVDGVGYRVSKINDWTQGGYRSYDAVEGYSPIPEPPST